MMLPFIGILISATVLGLLLASVVGLGVLWYRVLRRPKDAASGPSCGQCGYGVRGIGSMQCPECGADLREAGIVTPRRRGQVSPAMFVVFWTLCLPLPALTLSGIGLAFAPKVRHTECELTLQPQANNYANVAINISATGSGQITSHSGMSSSFSGQQQTVTLNTLKNTTPDRITMHLRPSQAVNNVPPLRLDPASMTLTGGPAAKTQPLSDKAIHAWLTHPSAVPADPLRTKEAAELAQTTRQLANGQHKLTFNHWKKTGGTSHYSSTYPVAWISWSVLAFWVLLYAAGLVGYFRIRRQRRIEADHAAASTELHPEPAPAVDATPAARAEAESQSNP